VHRGRQSLLVVLTVTSAPETDKEGFLRNTGDWNPAVAEQLAETDGIILTEDHWEVIHLVRDYYRNYRLFPANRVLVTKVRETFGESKGNSIHLMKLFTGKPAKHIAKIAGLPKPPNCD
jgi:tRNA 2-thiouridine synthesizing protein E